MSIKLITFCFTATSLLIGTAGCVVARGLGPNLPLLGDYKLAAKYVSVGNTALNDRQFEDAEADYNKALQASPFYEDATIGLARCAAAEGDYAEAANRYQPIIDQNKDDIDLLTEFVLVLQQSGDIPRAIFYYNHALDLCKRGLSVVPMDIFPNSFSPDGKDYIPNEMAAMTHVMKALNNSNDDMNGKSIELQKAFDAAPQSSIVYFYRGVLLQQAKKPGAQQAFKEALALDDGTSAKIITKWIQRSRS